MNEIEKQQHIEAVLRSVVKALDIVLTDKMSPLAPVGFALLVFEFNKPGVSNYISNASRADMIKALRKTADRLELKEDIPPAMDGVQ